MRSIINVAAFIPKALFPSNHGCAPSSSCNIFGSASNNVQRDFTFEFKGKQRLLSSFNTSSITVANKQERLKSKGNCHPDVFSGLLSMRGAENAIFLV